MSSYERNRRVSAWRIFYLCSSVTLSAVVFGIFLWKPGINGHRLAMFGDMIYGAAHKPYVCRALFPTTVRLLVALIPDETRASLSRSLGETAALDNGFKILRWEKEYLVEYLTATILMYLSLWGYLWALRYLFTGVYRASARVRDGLTLVALLGLTQFFRYYSYLYDFPTVFLFTLGLALMVRSRWALFLVVYLLACLNKETTILLTMIFVIHFLNRARMGRRHFAKLLLAQLAVFAVVRIGLALIFRGNAGSFVEVHLFDHNIDFLRACSTSTVLAWGGLLLLVLYRWSAKPTLLRHGLWIVVPLVVLTLFFGYLDELRDYYEVYPIVLLLLVHSVSGIVGFELVSVEHQPAQTGR